MYSSKAAEQVLKDLFNASKIGQIMEDYSVKQRVIYGRKLILETE